MVLQIYRFISIISYLHIHSYTIPIKIAIWGAPHFQTHPNCQDTQSCGCRYQRSRVDCCEVLSRPTVSQQCCKPRIEIRKQLFTQRIRMQVLDRSCKWIVESWFDMNEIYSDMLQWCGFVPFFAGTDMLSLTLRQQGKLNKLVHLVYSATRTSGCGQLIQMDRSFSSILCAKMLKKNI